MNLSELTTDLGIWQMIQGLLVSIICLWQIIHHEKTMTFAQLATVFGEKVAWKL